MSNGNREQKRRAKRKAERLARRVAEQLARQQAEQPQDRLPSVANKEIQPPRQKPVDMWLSVGALAVAVILYMLPKSSVVVVAGLVFIFGLLAHPVWHFWWIEDALWRRLTALIALIGALFYIGYASWPTRSTDQARIAIADILLVPPEKQPKDQTQSPAPYINFWYGNFGNKPAYDVSNYVRWTITDHPLSRGDEFTIQDKMHKEFDYEKELKKQAKQTIYPGPARQWFSLPNNPMEMTGLTESLPLVRLGYRRLYVFVLTKFRDDNMENNEVGVSEMCSYFHGDLVVRHNCGRIGMSLRPR
jgi:hypothetical protein